MNKLYLFVFLSMLFSQTVWADKPVSTKDALLAESKKPLKEDIFSVSTEEMSATDSLNRIAGKYDRGYSSPDQSFRSPDHGFASPFAREKAEASRASS